MEPSLLMLPKVLKLTGSTTGRLKKASGILRPDIVRTNQVCHFHFNFSPLYFGRIKLFDGHTSDEEYAVLGRLREYHYPGILD